ncbi:UNVERIFIED_CONTAM: kinesin-like protein Klp8 [Siphonaria sp. JEL0065]|nr:kinesin-like protein Klp8 [Siphonaria sp. JEL0065]
MASNNTAVFECLGAATLAHSLAGFNTCILCYGQTGSGKTHSMVGTALDPGLVQRVCKALFETSASHSASATNTTTTVAVSFLEIYNEKVRDLLNPANKANLRVREHPTLGPYAEDLSKLVVTSYQQIERLLEIGNTARTTAATNMNLVSSRSHAVFTIHLLQIITPTKHPPTTSSASNTNPILPASTISKIERSSRICLVDLAGSERADSTGATGIRLKEGSNINKSLTTLGKVISTLADASESSISNLLQHQASPTSASSASNSAVSPSPSLLSPSPYTGNVYSGGNPSLSRKSSVQSMKGNIASNSDLPPSPQKPPSSSVVHVPYRDSTLTWLLKDCIGGNSKTIMLATISSVESCLEESLSTLRYAERAKKIVNRAVVNEDETGKTVRLLQEEVDKLKRRLAAYEEGGDLNELVLSRNVSPIGSRRASVDASASNRGVGRRLSMLSMNSMSSLFSDGRDPDLLRDQLLASEKLIAEMTESYEAKLQKSEQIEAQQSLVLHELGISTRPTSSGAVGFHAPKTVPHLLNLSEDPSVSECLLYRLPLGIHGIGNTPDSSIYLASPSILKEHAFLECTKNTEYFSSPITGQQSPTSAVSSSSFSSTSGAATSATADPLIVILRPNPDGLTFLNNMQINYPIKLSPGDRILFGETAYFKYANPTEQLPIVGGGILRSAVYLKEANIISRELDKKVFYEFEIMENMSEFSCFSFWEQQQPSTSEAIIRSRQPSSHSTISFGAGSNNTPSVNGIKKPFLVVKVLDGQHNSCYKWLMPDFLNRLESMRTLYDYIDPDAPSKFYAHQRAITSELSFYGNGSVGGGSGGNAHGCPYYQCIGSVGIDVRCLGMGVLKEVRAPVVAVESGEILGWVLVVVAPISAVANNLYDDFGDDDDDLRGGSIREEEEEGATCEEEVGIVNELVGLGHHVEVGHRLVFEVSILEMTGVSELAFTQVHCQFRLSEFTGTAAIGNSGKGGSPSGSNGGIPADRVFATDPVEGFGEAPIRWNFSQTISMEVTEEAKRRLDLGIAKFQVFARHVRPIEEAIEEKFTKHASSPTTPKQVSTQTLTPSLVLPLPQRANDTKEHVILAQIQISELSSSTGEFKPVPVQTSVKQSDTLKAEFRSPADVFMIRQGIQRRITLRLSHSSGKHDLPWRRISYMKIGQIRRIDEKTNRPMDDEPEAPDLINLQVPGLADQDRSSSDDLPAVAMNHSFFSNNGQSSLEIEIPWDTSVHNCVYLNKPTKGFRLELTVSWGVEVDPLNDGSSTDISQWSVFAKAVQFEKQIAIIVHDRDYKVQASAKAFDLLSSIGFSGTGTRYATRSNALFMVETFPVSATLAPKTKLNSRTRMQEIDTRDGYVRGEESLGDWKPEGQELVIRILYSMIERQILEMAPVSFRGQLLTPNSSDIWVKRYFVIRRPYLHMYADASDLDELAIFSLVNTNIQFGPSLGVTFQVGA